MTSTEETVYDVAILGSGIAGSMLGAALARNGVRVALIDAEQHPKFAIGESTIPYTLVALRTIAERYDVPEIKTLATFTNCTKVIGPSFGVKKNFGFLLHHPGKKQDPQEVNMFGTPGLLHEASHLYRQDTDAYLFAAAVKYGCTPLQNKRVDNVDFDADGVTVHAGATQVRARYVVDASGFRSPIADKFALRENPSRLKHHSRALFNHMIGVPRTDDLFDSSPADTPPTPWYSGTVHHLFERGWFWVIGFDNHKASRNPLCSVGLTLDERKYPKVEGESPADEFKRYAAKFPDVERQYAGATAMREWVSTGRLQYSSKQTIGDRWCLLAHAAGFIDPLFSRGLSNTAESVNALAWRLIAATKDDDFSAERFEYVDRLQQGLLDYNDTLVNAAYISFADYDLWTAVFRIWAWGSNAGTFRLQSAVTEFLEDRNDQHFKDIEEADALGLYWPDHAGFKKLYDEMVFQLDAVEAGTTTPRAAADTLYTMLVEADYVPDHFGFADRGRRFLNPTPKTLVKTVRWALTKADPDVRKLMLSNGRQAIKYKLRGRRIF